MANQNETMDKEKETPGPMNVVEEMSKLPNMDILRIALAANAILHDRAMEMKAQEEETENEESNTKNGGGPKLVVPDSAK